MKIKGMFAVAMACFLLGTSVPYCAAKIADTSRTVVNAAEDTVTVDGMNFTLITGGYQLTSLVDKIEAVDVVVPSTVDGVEVIGIADKVFYEASHLESVEIPENVTEIGEYAFYNCSNLKSVSLPDSLTEIKACAFQGCISLEKMDIPKNIRKIGSYAFDSCKSITELTFPGKLTTINYYVAQNCTSLRRVTIEDGVINIYGGAFNGCKLLSTVTLPLTIKRIGYNGSNVSSYSFKSCPLKNIYYGGNADQWNSIESYYYESYGNVHYENLTPFERDFMDVNGDGYVDAKDASIILSKYSENATS